MASVGESGGALLRSVRASAVALRYRDSTLTEADQTGWSGTVSAELGAAYALGAHWMIEPVAPYCS